MTGRDHYIGSIKTNIGHTESVAGVVGVLKAALVIKHQTIPPNAHVGPLPDIVQKRMRMKAIIPDKPVRWTKSTDEELVASVSSFGFAGTNVNAILSQPSVTRSVLLDDIDRRYQRPALICVSADSEKGLKKLLTSLWYIFLKESESGGESYYHSFCSSVTTKWPAFRLRLAAVVKSNNELRDFLMQSGTQLQPHNVSSIIDKTEATIASTSYVAEQYRDQLSEVEAVYPSIKAITSQYSHLCKNNQERHFLSLYAWCDLLIRRFGIPARLAVPYQHAIRQLLNDEITFERALASRSLDCVDRYEKENDDYLPYTIELSFDRTKVL